MKLVAYLFYIINSFVLVRIAILFGVLIDNLTNSQFDIFRKNVLIMLIYGLLTLILPVISYKLAFKISNKEMNKIKNNKFLSEFTNNKDKFDLVDYSQNLDIYYSGQLMNKFNFVNILSVFIFTSISLISIDIRLFIIAFISSSLPLIVPIFSQKALKNRSETFVNSSDNYIKFIEDTLTGKKELIRYNGINWIKSIHENISKDHEDKRESFKLLNILNDVFSEGISNISQIVILFTGGIFVSRSIISIGEVITLLQLMNYLAGPVVALISLYNNYASSLVAKKRLIGETEIDLSQKDFKFPIFDSSEVAVDIENIEFSYGNNKVLNNLSYKFMKNKTYLIKGKSGSGKSTLLKIIAGELTPDKGKVLIFNKNIEDMEKSAIYTTISYISQDTHIFENSVENNILLGKVNENNKITNLIEMLELDLSLEDILSKERKISGGETVRIGIARCLIDPKDIIILDEHTSGLNEDLAFKITKEILNLGKTVICVSHTESQEIIDLFDECINFESLQN